MNALINALQNVDLATYQTFLYAWVLLGAVASVAIHYSRMLPISNRIENHRLHFLGTIDKKWGWIIMETPILVTVLYFYLTGSLPLNPSVVVVGAFVAHYVHRALIFPHRLKVEGKRMPLSMVLMTMVFYAINGYLIGHYFGSLQAYPPAWLTDPRTLLGLALFVVGFGINLHSDNILLRLRGPGETGYRIPEGGLFRYVSCPNYFGEIVEWVGFALMAWCLPATVYALWVGLTLFTTGLGTHRWYMSTFSGSYPAARKAVLPFLI